MSDGGSFCLDDLHSCPYCNSDNLYIDTYERDGEVGYMVACEDCGVCGPVSFDSVELAKAGWEKLNSRMCRHCMDRMIKQNKKLQKQIKELLGGTQMS